MAYVKFLKPDEVSQKNSKYIKFKRNRKIWQIVSFIELLTIIGLLLKINNLL